MTVQEMIAQIDMDQAAYEEEDRLLELEEQRMEREALAEQQRQLEQGTAQFRLNNLDVVQSQMVQPAIDAAREIHGRTAGGDPPEGQEVPRDPRLRQDRSVICH